MNNRKIILGIFIGFFFIGMIVIGVFHLREKEDSMPEISDDYQATIYELTLEEMGLTEEQYQLLRDSILHKELEQMNAIERRNAWLILNAMAEIEFVESATQGQSPVSFAAWILDLLGVGEIKELTVVRLSQGVHDLFDNLILRIVNEKDNVYYIWYPRSLSLEMVTRDSEDGEVIYERAMYTISDGRLCKLEYARGPILYCREE